MAALKTPIPKPKFFTEERLFSTKKERRTPRDALPPKPPVKSAPPISRVFSNSRSNSLKARAVSFRSSSHNISSPHYNEESRQLYFEQCFEIISKIGEGSFGHVYKVQSKEDGKYYAVKKCQQKFRGESDRLRKLEEVQKHEVLPKHPNCVEFFKAWEERQHLYLQIELCQISLSDFADQNHDIPEQLIWNYTVDLLMALKHLHDHDLIHMDVKPENIFISQDGICKLGDFGLVLDLKKGDLSDAVEGDPKYLAPELMDGKFGKHADVFSLGITVLELASDLDLPRGEDPWHHLREGNIPDYLVKDLSPELAKLIRLMMFPDYIRRPSIDDILSYAFVQKHVSLRNRQLAVKQILLKFKNLARTFLLFITGLWNLLVAAIERLFGIKPGAHTPHRQEQHSRLTSGWDTSYSDDDVFHDHLNASRNSLGMLYTGSSSSESYIATFDDVSSCLNSAPQFLHRDLSMFSTPPKSYSAKHSSRSRLSPNYPRLNLCRTALESSYESATDSLPEDIVPDRLNIGPKNLMRVFEAAELSDEDV